MPKIPPDLLRSGNCAAVWREEAKTIADCLAVIQSAAESNHLLSDDTKRELREHLKSAEIALRQALDEVDARTTNLKIM